MLGGLTNPTTTTNNPSTNLSNTSFNFNQNLFPAYNANFANNANIGQGQVSSNQGSSTIDGQGSSGQANAELMKLSDGGAEKEHGTGGVDFGQNGQSWAN